MDDRRCNKTGERSNETRILHITHVLLRDQSEDQYQVTLKNKASWKGGGPIFVLSLEEKRSMDVDLPWDPPCNGGRSCISVCIARVYVCKLPESKSVVH